MPGLFEQFPHTNLHELNLDWMIDLLNQFKQELEDRAVISVNGMTGEVTLYESENVVLPPLTGASSWRLVRMMDGQYVGILFQDGHIWLQQGNSTLKLLTTEDIPSSAGVVSINGMGGIVRLTGRDIPISNDPDADSIRLALETERTERVNADNALSNSINTTNQALLNFTSITPTSITDFNSVTTPGYYRAGQSATNAPTSGYWTVSVFPFSSTDLAQLAIEVNLRKAYIRTLHNGSWTTWQELALKSDAPVRTPTTITLSAEGFFVSQFLFEKVVSVTISDATNIFVGVRRSTTGNAVFYALDSNGQKITSTSFTGSVWHLP